MPDPQIVADMSDAVLTRRHPSITRWNRLEGRPRTHHFDRALNAEVRDALWMLARQWQMGEFAGDDAGSPVLARACLDTMPIRHVRTGLAPAERLVPEDPLEMRVERRPLPLRADTQYLSLDLRLVVGRRWLKLLARQAARPAPDGLTADYRAAYRDRYRVPVPDPAAASDAAISAHQESWQQAGAASGAMDGIALLEHLSRPGATAFDGIGAVAEDEPRLVALAARLRAWFLSLIAQPPAPDGDAWVPGRLEYQFACAASRGAEVVVLRAEEYALGDLDWYALEQSDASGLDDTTPEPRAPDRVVQTFLPASVVFSGMPLTRWWAFEDRRTNFGDVRPDTTDLGKLLLLEFALTYANDWFVLPMTLPTGSLTEARGIAVTNVFGERIWIEPFHEPSGDAERWAMFALSGAGDAAPPPARLLLPARAPKVQEGAPLEEVALVRDEMSNMVWGIERRVQLPSGTSKPGSEAAHEYRDHLQRLITAPVSTRPEPAAPIRYQVMNTVPEHWIPFIPVRVPGSVRETQLQRAALPRLLEGDTAPPAKVRPRTSLLRHGLPGTYFVFEEEVPRSGVLVSQSYQRTRRVDGRAVVWFGARKQVGRGESSSGLRFDAVVPSEPPGTA
jgi:hypothetical protein